jgi:diacylglycerol kinase family enzyme
LRAGLNAFFKAYRPCGGTVAVDGRHRRVDRLLSLMVVKQPFYGLGLKTVPQARWDDGRLHALTIPAGATSALAGLLTGFTIGNRVGCHRPGRRVSARFDRPLHLQIDGEVGWRSERFLFQVMPGCLKVRH